MWHLARMLPKELEVHKSAGLILNPMTWGNTVHAIIFIYKYFCSFGLGAEICEGFNFTIFLIFILL